MLKNISKAQQQHHTTIPITITKESREKFSVSFK